MKKVNSFEETRENDFKKFEEESNQAFQRITSITLKENDLKESKMSIGYKFM
jgi:hypothetical protein